MEESGQPFPDNKVHWVNMGPTWVLSAPDGPHVGPMNLAVRVGSIKVQWDKMVCLEFIQSHTISKTYTLGNTNDKYPGLYMLYFFRIYEMLENTNCSKCWGQYPYHHHNLTISCGSLPSAREDFDGRPVPSQYSVTIETTNTLYCVLIYIYIYIYIYMYSTKKAKEYIL